MDAVPNRGDVRKTSLERMKHYVERVDAMYGVTSVRAQASVLDTNVPGSETMNLESLAAFAATKVKG